MMDEQIKEEELPTVEVTTQDDQEVELCAGAVLDAIEKLDWEAEIELFDELFDEIDPTIFEIAMGPGATDAWMEALEVAQQARRDVEAIRSDYGIPREEDEVEEQDLEYEHDFEVGDLVSHRIDDYASKVLEIKPHRIVIDDPEFGGRRGGHYDYYDYATDEEIRRRLEMELDG